MKKTVSSFEYLYSTSDEGVEIPMGMNADGKEIIFKLRESGCKEHEKSQRRYQKSLSLTRKNPDKEHELLARIVAESIIIDWSNVIDEKGKEIPCTFETKFEALKKYKKLFYDVIKEASNEENFRDFDPGYDEGEDTEKNLSKS